MFLMLSTNMIKYVDAQMDIPHEVVPDAMWLRMMTQFDEDFGTFGHAQ